MVLNRRGQFKSGRNIFICCIFIVVLLSGCEEKKFDSYYKEYKKQYLDATSFVDATDNIFENLSYIDKEKTNDTILKLRRLHNDMLKEKHTKEEEIICDVVKKYNEYIEKLFCIDYKKDELTVDETRDAFRYYNLVYSVRKDILKEK